MLMRVAKKQHISSPEAVANVLREILHLEDEFDQEKEHFWVIGLNTQNVIKYIDLVSLGILNACPVHAREVFRTGVLKGVCSIIIAHNHPSDTLTPSPDDETTTKYLVEAGKILKIDVLDSIIITESSYYSFKNEGKISY